MRQVEASGSKLEQVGVSRSIPAKISRSPLPGPTPSLRSTELSYHSDLMSTNSTPPILQYPSFPVHDTESPPFTLSAPLLAYKPAQSLYFSTLVTKPPPAPPLPPPPPSPLQRPQLSQPPHTQHTQLTQLTAPQTTSSQRPLQPAPQRNSPLQPTSSQTPPSQLPTPLSTCPQSTPQAGQTDQTGPTGSQGSTGPVAEPEPPVPAIPAALPPRPRTDHLKLPSPPLTEIPDDIAIHREGIFNLGTTLHFTPELWDKVWPYIDNVWCLRQAATRSVTTGIAIMNGACRLHAKPPPPKPTTTPGRLRRRALRGTCPAKFRLTVYPDGRRKVEPIHENPYSNNVLAHNHSLEDMDAYKRSSGLRNLALHPYFKGWEGGGIIAYLRDESSKMPGNPLIQAGGRHLTRVEVTTVVNAALKTENPERDLNEIQKMKEKYANCTLCNYPGCDAPAFPTMAEMFVHRRMVHGRKVNTGGDATRLFKCPTAFCKRQKKSIGFASMEILLDHIKTKHGEETANATYLPADGTHPICTDDRTTRQRKRRSNLPPLNEDGSAPAPNLTLAQARRGRPASTSKARSTPRQAPAVQETEPEHATMDPLERDLRARYLHSQGQQMNQEMNNQDLMNAELMQMSDGDGDDDDAYNDFDMG